MRRAATRLSVASIGRPGPSTRTRGESRATSSRDVDHVRVLGEARLDHALEPGDQPGESLRAHHERRRASRPSDPACPVPLDRVCAIPRITVTGVRSSWPSRLTSSWRRAARSSSASWASSSWRDAAALPLEGLGELADHPGRHHRRDHAAAGGRLADRVEDLLAVGVLQHVAGGARDQHLPNGVLILDTGEGHDPHLGEGRLQQARRLDPVHLGHPDVHQDDVRLGGAHEAHGVGAARCGAHDDELLGPQQRREGLPEPRIVIHDGNPDVGTEWSERRGGNGAPSMRSVGIQVGPAVSRTCGVPSGGRWAAFPS